MNDEYEVKLVPPPPKEDITEIICHNCHKRVGEVATTKETQGTLIIHCDECGERVKVFMEGKILLTCNEKEEEE
uniref:Uncharacterized protein n=1 Tax=viral metagenome TaxID=1070528 RepID=A0A6M3ITK7_9ZZZZ